MHRQATKYSVILADPPWQYDDRPPRTSAEAHYPTMSFDELASLPVGDYGADRCALFLWATWPIMPAPFYLINAWGFTYKTDAFVWVKSSKSGMSFFMGNGHYTRANTEFCLLAFKGKPQIPADRGVHQVIYSPVREHSRKPDEQYGKIERMYPDAAKLELFARQHRPGWDVWGNEVESTVDLGLKQYAPL
jgi:N6-adenosine-specific RNA methylase IME4